MSSGPQPSTSTSSVGYNQILRGMARESNTMNSAKVGSSQGTANAYQLNSSNNIAINNRDNSALVSANNSLSINGVNEKLVYKVN